jgi:hypothetical protein
VTTIKSVFTGTPLEDPILDVLNCVVLMKVAGIQNGLTFVNENAEVQFPRVDNSSLGIALRSVDAFQQATQGSSSLIGILDNIINKWEAAIRRQAILAGVLMAVYLLVVFMGLARIIYVARKGERNRGEGGGLSTIQPHGIAWVRSRMARPAHVNPFEDSAFEIAPGPTPSMSQKH